MISSICGAGIGRGAWYPSLLQPAPCSLFVPWVSVWLFRELSRHGTGLLLVSISRSSCVWDLDLWSEILFNGKVCDFKSFLCFNSAVWILWIVSVVASLFKLDKWDVSMDVSGGCCRKILKMVQVLFWWSAVCQSQLRFEDEAFLASGLDCTLDTLSCIVFGVTLLELALYYWSFYPGGYLSIGSELAFLCEAVCVSTFLTK